MGDILYSERAPPTPVCESPSNTLHMDSFFAIKVLLRMFGFQKVIFLSRFAQMTIYQSWIPCYVLQQIITKQDHQRWRYITVNHLMGIQPSDSI